LESTIFTKSACSRILEDCLPILHPEKLFQPDLIEPEVHPDIENRLNRLAIFPRWLGVGLGVEKRGELGSFLPFLA
jgi:hypothetical protein